METRGLFAPDDAAAARDRWSDLGPAAQTVTRELARAMAFDSEEYDRRVTGEVVGTAREALFASLLAVQVGTREEFEGALEELGEAYDVEVRGSDAVENVAWHVAPAAATVVAATFQSEPDAAVAALRRQALGRCYRPLVGRGGEAGDAAGDTERDVEENGADPGESDDSADGDTGEDGDGPGASP